MSIEIVRTGKDDPLFLEEVRQLNAYLHGVDGENHAFYMQYNGLDALNGVVLAMEGPEAVGCGAFKHFNDRTVEIKRMWVAPQHRGKGIAKAILAGLEAWASEERYDYTVLETGKRMQDAQALYQRAGYAYTPNYGQYVGVEDSVCFRKRLASDAPKTSAAF